MFKGIINKLRGKDDENAPETSPEEIKAQAEVKAKAVAESVAEGQAKTEVIAPGYNPESKETVQLNKADIEAALKGARGPENLAKSEADGPTDPPKPSNYSTLPETVQLDKKRVQEILRQAKAQDTDNA